MTVPRAMGPALLVTASLLLCLAASASADRGGPGSPPVGPIPAPSPPDVGGADVDTDRPDREPSSAPGPPVARDGSDLVQRGSATPFASWRVWWDHAKRGLPAAPAPDVSPDLLRLLEDDGVDVLLATAHVEATSLCVRAAALTALAHLGDDSVSVRRTLYAPLRDMESVPDDRLTAAAAFAAVRLDDRRPATRALLLARVTSHRDDVSHRPAHAALALGLLGETEDGAVTEVLLLTATSPSASPEVRAAATLALGFLGDPAALSPLTAVLVTGTEDEPEMICRLDAVARLAVVANDAGVLPALESIVADGTGGRVRGAAALALARVLPLADVPSQRRATSRLLTVATKDDDRAARRAGLLALGRAASDARTDAVASGRLLAALEHALRRSRGDDATRGFAALGLGLAAGGDGRHAALTALRHVAQRSRADDLLGAIALARAAAADNGFVARATPIVSSESAAPALRADLVAAFGLLGEPAHRELVLTQLSLGGPPTLRRAAAEACGRLGDPAAAETLLAVVQRADDAQAARALGRVAAAEQARELIDRASSEDADGAARLLAIAALGHVRRRGHDPVDRLADAALAGAAIPAILDALAQP